MPHSFYPDAQGLRFRTKTTCLGLGLMTGDSFHFKWDTNSGLLTEPVCVTLTQPHFHPSWHVLTLENIAHYIICSPCLILLKLMGLMAF